MSHIAIAETVLFISISTLLTWLVRTSPLKSKAMRRVEWVLAALFGLAAIRVGLLASGIPVFVANLVTLVAAVLVFLGWLRASARSRGTARQE